MNRLLKLYLLAFVCAINLELIAQDRTLDSLKQLLKNTTNDNLKCNLLIALSDASTEKDWLKYTNEVITICEKNLKNSKLKKEDISEFKKYYATALIYKAGELEAYSNISVSIELYFKGLRIYEEIKDTRGLYACYCCLSNAYSIMKDLDKAIEFSKKALIESKKLADQTAIFTSFNLIGNSYYKLKNYPLALHYYKEMLEISLKLNNQQFIASSYNNIGMIYKSTEKSDSALYYLYKCEDMEKSLKDNKRSSTTLNNIASIFIEKKEYKKALNFASKSLSIAKEANNIDYISSASKSLYLIYKNENKPKEALKNYELYIQLRDSIYNQNTRNAAIKSQLKYEYEKKAAADSVKVAEERKISQLKLKQEKTQKQYLYIGLFAITLFGIFMFNRFRVTKKQKNIIEQQKVIVEQQKALVDEKQKEILESIHYAKRIQVSIMPSEKYLYRKIKAE